MEKASDFARRHSLTANFFILCVLQCFTPSSVMFPDRWVLESLKDVSTGNGLNNSELLLVVR